MLIVPPLSTVREELCSGLSWSAAFRLMVAPLPTVRKNGPMIPEVISTVMLFNIRVPFKMACPPSSTLITSLPPPWMVRLMFWRLIPYLTVHVRVLPSAMERVWSAPTVIFSVRVMSAVMLMVAGSVASSALFSASAVVMPMAPPPLPCAFAIPALSIMMLRSSKPRRRLAAVVL